MLLFFLFFLFSFPAESRDLFYRGEIPPPISSSIRGDKKSHFKPRPSSRGLYLKPFPIIYRPEIKRWIDFFSQNSNFYIKLWLKRSYRYFPAMEEIFQSYGLPKELVAMSLVESGLSSKAVSKAQAVGYWQFIKPTGLKFGLKINSWIDERRDFQKSSLAAAKYLYQLYEEFEDWLLSMSAYNMGESRLRRLIKKHQTKDFWVLYKKSDFPKETALYIPKILAVAQIIKAPERYGINNFPILGPYKYDVFFTPGGTNLKKMSKESKISLSSIKALNPGLKGHLIPLEADSYPVRIPRGQGLRMSNWLDKQKKSN